MRYITSTLIAFFLLSNAVTAQFYLNWAKQTGGANSDAAYDVATDASGNVYSAGIFTGVVDFDPGPGTFTMNASPGISGYVQKLNTNGNLQWARAIISQNVDQPVAVRVDASGNVYVLGIYSDSINVDPGVSNFTMPCSILPSYFVIKYSSSGAFLWAKELGAGGNTNPIPLYYGSMDIDNSGNVVVMGSFAQTVDFDPGPSTYTLTPASANKYDVFLAKLDPSGNFVWAGSIGGAGDDLARSVDVDASGTIYLTGSFENTADMDPGSGVSALTALGPQDEFVVKLNPSLSMAWAGQIGSSLGQATGTSIKADAGGNVFIGGEFNGIVDFDPGAATYNQTSAGSSDASILKLNSTGAFLWASRLGDTNPDNLWGISVDPTGNVYTTGNCFGVVDFDPGPATFTIASCGTSNPGYIQMLDGSGNFIWAGEMAGCSTSAQSRAICAENNPVGTIHTAGYFYNMVDFDPTTGVFNMFSAGAEDAFVCKLGPVCTCSGIREAGASAIGVMIYPNPAKENFNVQIDSDLKDGKIGIMNALGENVMSQQIRQGVNEIKCRELSPGIYFYELSEANAPLDKGRIVIE